MNKLLLTSSSSTNNFQGSTPTTTAFADQEYSTYKVTYTGSGTFALMAQETFSTQINIVDEFRIYPTVLSANNAMNIISIRTAIDHLDINAINGALMSSLELESRSQAK
jgi:hypothetical protein